MNENKRTHNNNADSKNHDDKTHRNGLASKLYVEKNECSEWKQRKQQQQISPNIHHTYMMCTDIDVSNVTI